MPGRQRKEEEDRFQEKVRAVSAIVFVATIVFVSSAVILLPLFNEHYAVSEGTLIAVLGALTPAAIAFAGAARFKSGD